MRPLFRARRSYRAIQVAPRADHLDRTGQLLSRTAVHIACISVLVISGLFLRWPALDVTSMRNEDVAGITYNADLLARGGVPYVDNLEYKAPGSFFFTWGVWKVCGRSYTNLERAGVFWALLAAIGMYVGGVLMFGTASGLLAGLIYTFWSPITDSLTVNYNAWMITPAIWAVVLFVAGLRRGGWGWYVAAGVALAVSGLMKRQAGVVTPLFVLVLALAPWLQRPLGWPEVRRGRALLAFCGGLVLGFLPITVFYLLKSGLSGVLDLYGQFVFSEAGWRYTGGGGEIDFAGKLDRLEDGFLGFWEFMALPTLLATMTLVSVPLGRQRGWTVLGLLLGSHFLLSFVGLSLGFRFYMGYYLQVLPAAAWLAAHADGPLLRWFRPGQWPESPWHQASRAALIGVLCVACVPAVLADGADLKKVRKHRTLFNAYQLEAEQIAKVVKENSRPQDSIWIWGRWAWPVYFHADRPSCTRFYKVLGVITNTLDNTWKRPTQMTRFNNSGPWREVGRDLARCKPLFIVTANNESYLGFKPLEDLLAKEYRSVPKLTVRAFRVHVRKDHTLKPPHGTQPPPAKPAAKPAAAPLARPDTTMMHRLRAAPDVRGVLKPRAKATALPAKAPRAPRRERAR